MRPKVLGVSAAVVWFLTLALLPVTGAAQSTFPVVQTLQFEGDVYAIAFSPDGRFLAVSMRQPDSLFVVDTTDSKTQSVSLDWTAFNPIPLRWSPDGSQLVCGPYVLNTETWSTSRALGFQIGRDGAFGPDGAFFAEGSDPIRLWETATWQVARRLYRATPDSGELAFSKDGNTLVQAAHGSAVFWDIKTGGQTREIKYLDLAGRSKAFSPDGRLLAVCSVGSGGEGQSVLYATLFDVASGVPTSAFTMGDLDRDLDREGAGLEFTPDGGILAAGIAREVVLLSSFAGTKIAFLEADRIEVTAIAVSKDGSFLAAGGFTGRVTVWDISALSSHSCSGFAISRVDWEKGCITLTNKAKGPLDLLEWTLSDGEDLYTFPRSIVVEPGKSYTICPDVYNPGRSKKGLYLDDADQEIYLFVPAECGGMMVCKSRR